MGKSSRTKGRKGQTEARHLLESRDWSCGDLSGGIDSEDLLAIDPDGITWACEVKNTKLIDVPNFRKQALEQAGRRKARWMLMAHVETYSGAWLILRQGHQPTVWNQYDNS